MRIAVPKETLPGERRVALVPESVKRLVKKGFAISVETNAGQAAGFTDDAYREAGAEIVADATGLLGGADVVFKVNAPEPLQLAAMPEGSTLVAFLKPLTEHEQVRRLAARKLTTFAVELVPRTTLAQSMDALSSMATVSGYKAVLLAADALPKFFPMLTTAAGTVAPAKVLILGAGVAGLQAIATARRLGAQVEAFDQRPATKEQVESLGAKFVEVPSEESAETAGGYAKELSEDYKRRQSELIRQRIGRADVVITTALIPGKRAPLLIPEDFVSAMAPGSVIVDLAAEAGGNCALTKPGETAVVGPGVTVIGLTNLPALMPNHASQLYSRNLEKLLLHLATPEGFTLDREEAITKGCLLTHGGEVVHETVKPLLEATPHA
ncbi:MAG TPA: Re/Si-specific NAD(P)(+) transhydrogenase subunit alpha [Oscillatoriaceae cyanobacterium]